MYNLAPTRAAKAKRAVSGSASLPAPVGGWNARDSLGEMAPTDAVALVNLFPTMTDCLLRLGYTQHATGMDGTVESLLCYTSGTAEKLFGVTDAGKIYDCTSAGAVGAAAVTTLTNGRFQYVNMTTAANSYLIAVNGADKARYYTGAAWAKDGDGAPYDVSVLNTATAIDLTVHKGRIWYVQKDTLKAYYLASGVIGGAATLFDLSSIAQMGGELVAVDTWTIDAGYGVDDLLVFVTSKGEVLVYRGTDPSSSTTWAIVGVWRIGSPVGNRCLKKFAGDLLVLCEDGLMPMSGALQSSRLNPKVALSDKIQYAMSQAISTYGSTFGWETLLFPRENMLWVNVPTSSTTSQQYVMNTISKAWCSFTGWNAHCWEIFQNSPYFGGSGGIVYSAWNTYSDDNNNITAFGLQAFNYFGKPALLKRATMMRPIISSSGSVAVNAAVNYDFDKTPPTSSISIAPTSYGVWDTSKWDAGIWGGDLQITKYWQGVTGMGYSLAPAMSFAADGVELRWISTDIVMERGAIL